MLLWPVAATPLWIAGAVVAPEARLLWWGLAAGTDTIGRWLAHPIPGRRLHSENVPFDADHMLECCRLFLLIHPQEPVSLALGLLLVGGPILFLAAQGWYIMVILEVRSQLHWIGGVGLVLVLLVTLALPAYLALILVGTCLTGLAILDQRMTDRRQATKGEMAEWIS
jgi:low temperature requirement protein LtrA